MKILSVAVAVALVASAGAFADAAASGVQGHSSQANRGQAAANRYQPRTERGQLAAKMIRQWAPYVLKVYGTAPSEWAEAMSGTFAQADIDNMRKAASRQTYEGMTAALLGQSVSDDEVITMLAKSDGSQSSVMALGSPSQDLVFTMIQPCRIADTRIGAAIGAGQTRHFISHGASFAAQGGANNTCGIPADPSAVVMNVTVVNPNGGGYLTVYPYLTTRPLAASLNYKANEILGNEIVTKMTLAQSFDFSIYSLATTHVVVDAVGYFMAPNATALDCTTVATTYNVAAASTGGGSATCAAGYTVTGGGCDPFYNSFTDGSTLLEAEISGNGYRCYSRNASASSSTGNGVQARCCRVPGR